MQSPWMCCSSFQSEEPNSKKKPSGLPFSPMRKSLVIPFLRKRPASGDKTSSSVILVTANQDTSAIVTLLSVAEAMPVIHQDRVCYGLFDSHPLNGISSYCKSHKEETDNQIVLNLDCVGNGDHIVFFPTKELKKDKRKLNPIYTCCGQFGNKFITIRDKGFACYPSDLSKFPYGIRIASFRKKKTGLWLSRIHTKRDAILDQTNVNILRAAICTLISCDAMQ